ncbi:hypothetical protein GOP47_0025446 [Adiantum capillus-veneris]|uniref:Uncharacterized protein n=1 Tax=Adiantum capillus-veneris TaxID=13818 RepID=A0A9D4U0Z5_ADICA|nr:hypothetical protein GOP47_0025446 [Adiantum capillus-veneris]
MSNAASRMVVDDERKLKFLELKSKELTSTSFTRSTTKHKRLLWRSWVDQRRAMKPLLDTFQRRIVDMPSMIMTL